MSVTTLLTRDAVFGARLLTGLITLIGHRVPRVQCNAMSGARVCCDKLARSQASLRSWVRPVDYMSCDRRRAL